MRRRSPSFVYRPERWFYILAAALTLGYLYNHAADGHGPNSPQWRAEEKAVNTAIEASFPEGVAQR